MTHGAGKRAARTIDWRGWLILAWALWFGFLYGKMVVEQRADRLKGWIARPASVAR